MKRLLLGATLLGVLPLGLSACGGEASAEAPAETTEAAQPLPAEQPEPVDLPETEPTQEQATTETAKPKKKNAKGKKNAQKKKAKKQRQVAVALGKPNEFDLVPAKAKVKAGKVTFKLKNTGAIEHELIVIRTDLDSGGLPTDENGAAMEHGAVAPHGTDHTGEEHAHVGTHVAAGEATAVTVKLKPGSYALVCNLPGHYASGMHSNLTVTS